MLTAPRMYGLAWQPQAKEEHCFLAIRGHGRRRLALERGTTHFFSVASLSL